jgi:hypothetical protein
MNFAEIIKDADTPVVLVDGSPESFEILNLVREVRDNAPCITFDDYWTPEWAKKVYEKLVDVQSFTFKPVEVESDGGNIWATYQTNICRLTVMSPYDDRFFTKVLGFEAEAKMVPAWLWTKTFAPRHMRFEYFNGDIWQV